MPVPIHREPPGDLTMETCCFCRRITPMWTSLEDRSDGQQVACCKSCAREAEPKDVPSKEAWCRREAIVMGRT